MQVANMALQFGTFYGVSAFFSGFLLMKLPFPLTERFKAVTQQGIGVPALDTSFVSAVSMYAIAMFGVPRVLGLFTRLPGRGGEDVAASAGEEARLTAMRMGSMPPGMGGGGGAPPFVAKTAFKGEVFALATTRWVTSLRDAELELLGKS